MPAKDQVKMAAAGLPQDHPLSTAQRPALVQRRDVARTTTRGLIAWLYGRESDDDGGRSSSVENQNALSREAIDTEGLTLTREFNTSGKPDRSASHHATQRRLHWEQLVAELIAAAVDPSREMPDVIVLPEVSRADRRAEYWTTFLRLVVEPLNLLIYVVSEERFYNPRKNADWRALATAGVDAEHEVRKIVSRTTRDLPKRMAAGHPCGGRAPRGWRVKRDRLGQMITEIDGQPIVKLDRKRYVIVDGEPVLADEVPGKRVCQFEDPSESWLAKEITNRVGRRHPPSVIAKDLTKRKVLTPGDWARQYAGEEIADPAPWTSGMVTRIASNIRNIGKVVRGGEVIEGQWDAIVDQEDWDAAQVVMRERHETADGAPKPRPGRTSHLLRPGCGCGADQPMSGNHKHKKHGKTGETIKRRVYTCRASTGCARQIKADALDAYVVRVVAEYLGNPTIYGRLAMQDDSSVMAAYAARDAAKRELDELYADVEAGKVSRRMAQADEARLLKAINDADERAQTLAVSPEVRKIIGMTEAASSVSGWLMDETVPLAARRDAIRRLVSITVNDADPADAGKTITADIVRRRVTVLPRCPRGCGAVLNHTGGRWTCGGECSAQSSQPSDMAA